MQHYTVYFIWKLLYMFWVVPSPIIRSANNCIYSICYLSHRYCYLPLSWKSWNRFECAVGGLRYPKHVQQFPDKINCVMLHRVGYMVYYNIRIDVCGFLCQSGKNSRTVLPFTPRSLSSTKDPAAWAHLSVQIPFI
jgi:hypothetical protein